MKQIITLLLKIFSDKGYETNDGMYSTLYKLTTKEVHFLLYTY